MSPLYLATSARFIAGLLLTFFAIPFSSAHAQGDLITCKNFQKEGLLIVDLANETVSSITLGETTFASITEEKIIKSVPSAIGGIYEPAPADLITIKTANGFDITLEFLENETENGTGSLSLWDEALEIYYHCVRPL